MQRQLLGGMTADGGPFDIEHAFFAQGSRAVERRKKLGLSSVKQVIDKGGRFFRVDEPDPGRSNHK